MQKITNQLTCTRVYTVGLAPQPLAVNAGGTRSLCWGLLPSELKWELPTIRGT